MNMPKRIKTPYGFNRALAKEMQVTEAVVSRALRGHQASYRDLRIRKRAKELLNELNEKD